MTLFPYTTLFRSEYDKSEGMLLALLSRAEPDGSGVNLHLRHPCNWLPPHASLTAYETLLLCDERCVHADDHVTQPLITAFAAEAARQRAYRENLPPALANALVPVPIAPAGIVGIAARVPDSAAAGGLCVRELLKLIVAYVLTPAVAPAPYIVAPAATAPGANAAACILTRARS
jgi:hypothetical protein